MSCLKFLCLLLLFAPAFHSVEYSYDDQTAWNSLENSQCAGRVQSPINIITSDLEDGDEIGLTQLRISYLTDALYGKWENNGHSLQFTPDARSRQKTLQTYQGTYELVQFHFHWGPNNRVGSEHTVNGKQYSGELHFVHKTTAAGAQDTDFNYYTVIGVFLEADDISATGTIWAELSRIPDYDMELNISVSDINYDVLLPDNLEYYYYNGSLTTPLCNQIVQWVVLKNPISVPQTFFTRARTTEEEDGGSLQSNYRDTQPLNGRKVYDSAAGIIIPTITLLISSLFVAVFVSY